jgi:hypothetical protein
MVKRPDLNVASCVNCIYSEGEIFEDPEDKEIGRIYCTARYANVNADMMQKFCDFYKYNPKKD